jgi:RNA recognition motif-containing protein
VINQYCGKRLGEISYSSDMPRVYVGKLSYHVREKDLQRFFSGYGKLLEVDLKNG